MNHWGFNSNIVSVDIGDPWWSMIHNDYWWSMIYKSHGRMAIPSWRSTQTPMFNMVLTSIFQWILGSLQVCLTNWTSTSWLASLGRMPSMLKPQVVNPTSFDLDDGSKKNTLDLENRSVLEVPEDNIVWLVVWTPLKNMKVIWDDSSQYMEK